MKDTYRDYLKAGTKDLNDKAETTKKELEEIRKEIAKVSKERETALDGDNTEQYLKSSEAIKKLYAALQVKERKKSNLVQITAEDYKKAWERYADDYNKEFSRKYAAYLKDREKLADEYEELIRLIAEGNRETTRAALDINAAENENAFRTVPGITKLLKPTGRKIVDTHDLISVDGLMLAEAKGLNEGRRDNIAAIENGTHDGDIYDASLWEVVRGAATTSRE